MTGPCTELRKREWLNKGWGVGGRGGWTRQIGGRESLDFMPMYSCLVINTYALHYHRLFLYDK